MGLSHVLLMLDRDLGRLGVGCERPLRAVIDLDATRKECFDARLSLLDDVRREGHSVDTLAGCVPELQPVDGPRIAVARVGGLDVGDPVLHELGNDLAAQTVLGLVQSGLLAPVEVGKEQPDVLVLVGRAFVGLGGGRGC